MTRQIQTVFVVTVGGRLVPETLLGTLYLDACQRQAPSRQGSSDSHHIGSALEATVEEVKLSVGESGREWGMEITETLIAVS